MRSLPAEVPVELGREAAQRLAEQELARPVYRAAEPTLLERIGRWVLDRLGDLLGRAADASPGGLVGVVALVVLAVLAAVVVRRGLGPLARSTAVTEAVFTGGPRSADEHRAAADAAAAVGDWAVAVVERFRAIARAVEERGLLDERPGRTADEVAAEAGRLLLRLAPPLADAAILFDGVRYGGRTAGVDDDRRLRQLDAAVQASRPARTTGTSPPAVAVPR